MTAEQARRFGESLASQTGGKRFSHYSWLSDRFSHYSWLSQYQWRQNKGGGLASLWRVKLGGRGSPTTRNSAIGSPTTCDSVRTNDDRTSKTVWRVFGKSNWREEVPTTRDSAIGSPTTHDSVSTNDGRTSNMVWRVFGESNWREEVLPLLVTQW